MKKIAIVDDNYEYIGYTKKTVEAVLKEIPVKIREFSNARNLLYEIEDEGGFDLYILDIEMEEMNGMRLAKEIRKNDEAAGIIFLTSYSDFALEGYEVNAFRYIIKDRMEEKLPEVLKIFAEEELSRMEENYYEIMTNYRMEKFKISELIWFYKQEKNTVFVTETGIFRKRISVSDVLKELEKETFVLVERGRAVNLKHVRQLRKNVITLSNGEKVNISRVNLKNVKQKITEYWSEKL